MSRNNPHPVALTPRSPLKRMQWRLTGLVVVTAALTSALVITVLGILVAFSLAYSPDNLRDLEAQMRKREPEVRRLLEADTPDRRALTEILDRAVREDETSVEPGLQLQFMWVSLGRLHAAITDARGEILAATTGDAAFAPGTPLREHISPGEEAVVALARGGGVRAQWVGSRLVVAGSVMKDGRVIGTAFARSDAFLDEPSTWASFFTALIGTLIWFGLGNGIVGGVFGYFIARALTRRLLAISRAADAWAAGNLGVIAPDSSADELGILASRLNQMAGRLQQVITLRNSLAALEERQRITRDLHDTVKQEAFATAMMVGSARKCLDSGDAAGLRRALDEAFDLSRQMQTDLSAILTQMRSPISSDLTERLEQIVEAWQRRTTLTLRLRLSCSAPDVPTASIEQVTRIADEALANVVKHSQATEAEVLLDRDGDSFRLTVTDDGVGPGLASEHKGLGLVTMRERAALLPGGRIEVGPATDGGTSVTLQFER